MASVLVRALWAGRRGVSVLHAIAAFLATPKTGVAELDLSKAFDTINKAMQAHALCRHLRHVLLRAWKAPGASPFLALDVLQRALPPKPTATCKGGPDGQQNLACLRCLTKRTS